MNRLDQLIADSRGRAARAERTWNFTELERIARLHHPRGFRNKLHATAKGGPAIIAELKRASPFHGVIRAEFAVAKLAEQLAGGGASALSVLTEERAFRGSLEDLETASRASGLPCLRKDFIVSEFQIIEARAYKADAVLLILAALKDSQFQSLLAMAKALELDVLCEVHDEGELDRALAEGADMIGVNSRDLRNFDINHNAFNLIEKIPHSAMAVAESGLCNGTEIRYWRDRGYDAFLIGQTLMEADKPRSRFKALLAEAASAADVIRGMRKEA